MEVVRARRRGRLEVDLFEHTRPSDDLRGRDARRAGVRALEERDVVRDVRVVQVFDVDAGPGRRREGRLVERDGGLGVRGDLEAPHRRPVEDHPVAHLRVAGHQAGARPAAGYPVEGGSVWRSQSSTALATQASYSARVTARTVKYMSAWERPQNSAHWPPYVPGLLDRNSSSFVRPGTTSIFVKKAGT